MEVLETWEIVPFLGGVGSSGVSLSLEVCSWNGLSFLFKGEFSRNGVGEWFVKVKFYGGCVRRE